MVTEATSAREAKAYRNMARILRPFLMATTRQDWHGSEHLPEGGFIAAANHVTAIDPLTMTHFLYDNGYRPKIMAKSSLWSVPVVGRVLSATGQIPVYRGTKHAGESLDGAAEAIGRGECVEVFPEGTLTRDPDLWPMLAKTGIARLALRTQAPVIPIAQWGAHKLLAPYGKMLKPIPRKVVSVVAGPAVDLTDLYDGPTDVVALRTATNRIMAAVTAQLAQIRGIQSPEQPFDPRQSRSQESR